MPSTKLALGFLLNRLSMSQTNTLPCLSLLQKSLAATSPAKYIANDRPALTEIVARLQRRHKHGDAHHPTSTPPLSLYLYYRRSLDRAGRSTVRQVRQIKTDP